VKNLWSFLIPFFPTSADEFSLLGEEVAEDEDEDEEDEEEIEPSSFSSNKFTSVSLTEASFMTLLGI
jgi:hypothetical protein